MILGTALLSSTHVQIANRAEKAINKIIDNEVEFYRKFCNKPQPAPPDGYQYLWLNEYAENDRCVHVATPRTRKTTTAAMHFLRKLAKTKNRDLLHVGPAKSQTTDQGYKMAYEWIMQSELLQAFIKRTASGKQMLFRDGFEFFNNSKWQCFGSESQIPGFNASDIWIEEGDDFPADRFKDVFDRGMSENPDGTPNFTLITGMIKTRGNLHGFENDDMWHSVYPRMDLHLALRLGILNKDYAKSIRGQYSLEEWLRLMHLIYVESRNFIWESKLHLSQIAGLKWKLKPVLPIDGKTFRRVPGERIGFGMDMGAQGSSEDASDYSLHAFSKIGRFRRWLFGVTWPPSTPPSILINDVCKYWRFFRPDGGFGDALDANLLTQINTKLYQDGLVDYDWSMFGDNSSTAWKKWAEYGLFAPLRNSGLEKHHMYTSLKSGLDNISYINDKDFTGNVIVFPLQDRSRSENHWKILTTILREYANLQSEYTKAGYLSISRINKKIQDDSLGFEGTIKIGDDNADASAMANRFLDFLESLETQGEMDIYTETMERVA